MFIHIASSIQKKSKLHDHIKDLHLNLVLSSVGCNAISSEVAFLYMRAIEMKKTNTFQPQTQHYHGYSCVMNGALSQKEVGWRLSPIIY